MTGLRRFLLSEDGGAAELALVAPFAVALVLGAINMGFMAYSAAVLHFAVEDAARCGGVKATCKDGSGAPDATLTQTYAQAQYGGLTTNPTFTVTVSDPSCVIVSAAATYKVVLGITHFNVPLNARACYPKQPTSP